MKIIITAITLLCLAVSMPAAAAKKDSPFLISKKEFKKGDRGIAPALIINARLDIAAQQYQRAREALSKYIQVEPDDPEAHFLMGETYRKEAPSGPDFSDCLAAYGQALAEDSGYAPAYKELGMAYRVQQENDKARDAFDQYLALAADAPDAGIIRAYLEGLQ